ncbi:Imm7 family immunity protein [Streptomyces sp. NPDC093586]|uniref:Imm7 family immunity protein n=1 Tax=Streptomyces sp. NPDC093586 TaxID=3366042 RepID=UPI0038159889
MYEFHGWFGVSEGPYEDDSQSLRAGVEELRARIDAVQWSSSRKVVLDVFNGLHVVTATGQTNRIGYEAGRLDELVAYIARRFPGSWGLLYDRSDEGDIPNADNAFRVRVMRRGAVEERLDPFLSPCDPVIEN